MSVVVLLTAEDRPDDRGETVALAAALADLGVEPRIRAWTDPHLTAAGAELFVIRTTWDYTTRLPQFLDVLGALPAPLLNDVDVVRWNSHKGYLARLGEEGVPVVPTVVVHRSEATPGPAALPDPGTDEIVVKPAVSAGARGTARFRAGSSAARDHLQQVLVNGDALVQAFRARGAGRRAVPHLQGRPFLPRRLQDTR